MYSFIEDYLPLLLVLVIVLFLCRETATMTTLIYFFKAFNWACLQLQRILVHYHHGRNHDYTEADTILEKYLRDLQAPEGESDIGPGSGF